jgi:hypothetical protein
MADVVPITAPSRAELWSRLCLAKSMLSHRAPSRDTVAVVLQVLDGAGIADLIPPAAVARLDGRYLVVDDCPHCHRQHHHGAGDPASASYPLYGHRVGHCGDGGGGYYLVPPHPEVG